jgi:PQQ-like domain
VLWTWHAGDAIESSAAVTSSPAVAKGKVVVATADGQVICFG